MLWQAFARRIEGSNKNTADSTLLLEAVITQDLKLQVDDKALQLEKLLHEVNGMQQARDDAWCANDELLIARKKERAVSLNDVFSVAMRY